MASATGIPINVYEIGFWQEYIDVYRDWYVKRDAQEDGCVLVRPDRFVAWRAKTAIPDCESKLTHIFNHILSRHEL